MDIVLATLALVALSPIIAATALTVRVCLGSPVIFRQVRPGIRGRPFTLYKFRSMGHAVGPGEQPLPDADRLTPAGRFLRSTSLDELPELWNVLRGDMSLVGPRPLMMEYLSHYSATQARRHEVRPGITGWAQIHGRNSLQWEERLAMDVWYVDNRSLGLDLQILLRTVWKVLRREGVSQEGEATMRPFTGS